MLKNVDLTNSKKNPNLRPLYLIAYPSVTWNLQLQLYKLPAPDWKDLGCGSIVASWSSPKSTLTTVDDVPRLNLGAAAFFMMLAARFLG